jgi:hypothetical protein
MEPIIHHRSGLSIMKVAEYESNHSVWVQEFSVDESDILA